MAKYLVIVESPAKAKTIKKFLGSNYKVEASNGHVRDLPKSQLGVDVEDDFEPKYITIRGKGELLSKLRKEVKKAQKVFLATDPDREGEAISWHLLKALNLEGKQTSRISFNEITKNAVKNSIKDAREIDMDLVDAQQARRILDRIVGYKISPLLWKKIKKGLSAGRVQSVALRLICDREDEINDFIPEEYWTLEAFLKINEKEIISCKFYGKGNEKIKISTQEELLVIETELKNAEYKISDIRKSERIKKTLVPFITSTLQQEASKKLNFSTQKTMRIAQQLYEGVDVEGEGTVGLITYLRTDSTRISEEADSLLRDYIRLEYGEHYLSEVVQEKKSTKKVQDAHEAIRPTYVHFEPDKVKKSLSKDQYRLYQLIWTRFVASRMQPAKYITTSIKIDANDYRFTTSTSTLAFDGFLKVYKLDEEEEKENNLLNVITKETELKYEALDGKQHFTQPPPRYNEASLVKILEELGIGRPSTYSPTITTIIQRRYIIKENKSLFPTELGEIVNSIMKEYFQDIVDTNFTAKLEKELDQVEEGLFDWKQVLRDFYPEFSITVDKAEEEIGDIKLEEEVTDIVCEECSKNMVIRYGRHGKFLACPGFPDCRNTKPYYEKIGVTCPKCTGDIVIKKTKKGRRFFGCENNPECDFMTWQKPTDKKCPNCKNVLLEKGKKLVCVDEKCNYQTENIK
ncbi:DNA topoisomerase I [Natranaerovirga pectinivora]|uniref:DNA topoisomerase 1 n=1 Tax=Natranaerovirga pectinivora TaxID=682400 RepID=A0A4R3MTL9_9FIRM|nr:type I DNA topoisomerase [Natranaerovirga pectinivora]TCT16414.1 DNA topoisomerase I [Natranaerovirga pectinivora]